MDLFLFARAITHDKPLTFEGCGEYLHGVSKWDYPTIRYVILSDDTYMYELAEEPYEGIYISRIPIGQTSLWDYDSYRARKTSAAKFQASLVAMPSTPPKPKRLKWIGSDAPVTVESCYTMPLGPLAPRE